MGSKHAAHIKKFAFQLILEVEVINNVWNFLNSICKALHWLGAIIMVICTFLSFIAVIARYLVGSPFTWSDEMTVLMMFWFVYLAQPLLEIEEGQLNLSILVDYLPAMVKKILRIIKEIFIIVVLTYIGFLGLEMAQKNFEINCKTPSVGFPVWFNNYLLVVVMMLIVIIKIISLLRWVPFLQKSGPDADARKEELTC
ncbi:hypothetical protein DXT63_05640 [Thermoanaerobacteraceae bacterium SP2]|nr:hypothetical protein DXT63_05640 [Thermoanaerobacteraceae bacterium SP2]